MRRGHTVALLALAAALVAATPFFVATTFFGDDHLFLAFARHVGNPFLPFVKDLHGGEYYRPLWMFVWWLLAKVGGPGGLWPFALAALALHAGAAALVFVLLRTLGRPFTVSASAGALMFLAPQNLAAALWFSATTDLLATVFVLGSLIALLRRRRLLAALTALAAFLSKESAFVLPLLSAIVLALRARTDSADSAASGAGHRSPVREVVPQAVLLAAVCVVREVVLRGWGGSGDPRAGFAGTSLQIWAGFAQTLTGETVFPPPLALAVGTTVLALTVFAIARQGGRKGNGLSAAPWAPLAFAVAAAAPLFAAGWAVGARYYYLPSVGLCWAVAEALAGAEAGAAARATVAVGLLAVGGLQAAERRQEVVSYDRRVAAARRAVAAGLGAGHHVFHIDGGIKDSRPRRQRGAGHRVGRRPGSGRRAGLVRDRAAAAGWRGGVAGGLPAAPPERRLQLRRGAGRRARPPGRRARSGRGARSVPGSALHSVAIDPGRAGDRP